jgi:3-hydroxybutyrate dehydrogenase
MLTSPFLLARAGVAAPRGGGGGRRRGRADRRHRVGPRARRLAVQGRLRVGQARRPRPGQDARLEGAGEGITATALCPGYVRTPLVERQIPGQARAHGLSEEDVLEQVLLAPQAVKRLIEPAEVAAAVAFLAGPSGSAFTGVAVPMDLGWSAR